MKTVSGSVLSSKPVSLSKASSILKEFMSSDNGASHALRVYVKRTSASLNGLVQFHSNLTSGKSERKKKKKSKVEVIDNGVLTDAEKNYEEEAEEIKSVGNTEGVVKTERKKRKKGGGEMGDVEEERDDSRSNKKRKH